MSAIQNTSRRQEIDKNQFPEGRNMLSFIENNRKKLPFSEKIMEALVETLDIELTDSIHSIRKLYTNNEIFEKVLEYEGFIGYGNKIRELVLEIYEIDLNKVED